MKYFKIICFTFFITFLGISFQITAEASEILAVDTEETVETNSSTLKQKIVGPTGVEFPRFIKVKDQIKHIPSSPGYIEGRSQLGGNLDFALHLLNTHGGKPSSIWHGTHKQVFSHSSTIGRVVDKDTGIATLTRRGTIHYSGDGAHIVPARPL